MESDWMCIVCGGLPSDLIGDSQLTHREVYEEGKNELLFDHHWSEPTMDSPDMRYLYAYRRTIRRERFLSLDNNSMTLMGIADAKGDLDVA